MYPLVVLKLSGGLIKTKSFDLLRIVLFIASRASEFSLFKLLQTPERQIKILLHEILSFRALKTLRKSEIAHEESQLLELTQIIKLSKLFLYLILSNIDLNAVIFALHLKINKSLNKSGGVKSVQFSSPIRMFFAGVAEIVAAIWSKDNL